LSSSPIHPVLGHLADLAGDAAGHSPGLLAVLATAADPRHRRGVRHRLAVILGLAVCAVLAGARSFTAIAEWAADADEQTLARLGAGRAVPSESTFRRTLQGLDADAFDDLAGRWAARRTAPGPGGRRVVAVDGKTLRGSGHGSEDSRHLLAAYDHAHGAVLGQVEVGAKTNEIPLFSELMDRLEDRLHWVRDMDFDEDRSQVRTASGPRIMASLRNLVITILRLAGTTSIAAALRYHARRPSRPLQTIMNC
jgi:DDE_Tnp_1-associated/Transposase DDE domain